MRLLVCGGRDWRNISATNLALYKIHARRPVTLLIHGNARGADSLAAAWARQEQIATLAFPADWDVEGRAAGPRRNQRMIDEGRPDGVVAFPGGRGTEDMVRRAEAAGLKVWRPYGPALK